MRLTVLGASGSYPGPGQACSGYLLQAAGKTLWIDAGSGSLANLQRHVGLLDVDAIVLSHEHPDHCADAEGYYVACKYYLERDHVPVYAPAGLQEQMYFDDEPFVWHTIDERSQVSIGDLALSFSRTDHGPETLAVRIDNNGRSFAYTSDTGPDWSLDELGAGVDVALCEATYLAEHEGQAQHLSGRQAAQMASSAGVGRLLLTHLQPGTRAEAIEAEAREHYEGPLDVVRENEVYEL
jgi:ribonuclease BN (tRNA processing enzyme)